jgi:hypothetical protein
MARRPAKFTVQGIEPANDPAWALAGPEVRRAFWRAVVAFTLKAHDQQTAAGLDRFGRTLVPIKESTRRNRKSEMGPADPDAPPLTPAHEVSRTRLNLTGKALDNSAVFTWTDGWGRVLAIHAKGSRKRGLPVRDVIGLSDDSLRKVRNWALGWWLTRKRTGVAPTMRPITARVPRLVQDGTDDYGRFTFGIGASGDPAQEVATARRLFDAGLSTGFRQKVVGKPPVKPPGLPLGAPRPPRAPTPARTPTIAQTATQGEPRWVKAAGLGSDYVTVEADVAKVEAAYSRDATFYVGRGGQGGIDDRYQRFGEFLDQSIALGRPIEQPRVGLGPGGTVMFGDGRHRWAVVRDRGATTIPVSVRRSEAAEFRRLFGA